MLKTQQKNFNRLPFWFKQEISSVEKLKDLQSLFRSLEVNTVCESAHCPNRIACWSENTATFMILGNVCTRACRFCAVLTGTPNNVNQQEPVNVALAVKKLGLKYVVITSVTRDDLEDGGANQFLQTVREVKRLISGIKVEVLIPDFLADKDSIKIIVDSKADVIGHNLETVESLSEHIRPQASYGRSLKTLKLIKDINPDQITKSGLMVGLGETREELYSAMKDLIKAGCDILTLGQYLAPSQKERHVEVARFVNPDEFTEYRLLAEGLGFKHVVSAPLVRSSYIAHEVYNKCINNL